MVTAGSPAPLAVDTTMVGRSAPPALRFEAIGCRWAIEASSALPPSLARDLVARTATFDALWSRFRTDSVVAEARKRADGGVYNFGDEGRAIFELYDRLYDLTEGRMDPLVGGDLEGLGYGPDYALKPLAPPVRAALRAGRVDWRQISHRGGALTTDQAVHLDIGAVGKGALVDILSGMLRDAGFLDFIVDGGGDLRHAGPEPVRVGLEHPFVRQEVIGVIPLANAALCGSAVNRRAWGEGLHHILDARTGEPVAGVVATWAVAGCAALADGLATALFLVEPARLAALFEFSFVRMFEDGRADCSPDLVPSLFFVPA